MSTPKSEFEAVRLCILMRTDMESMTGTAGAYRRIGKACAQAAHAANQCVCDIRNYGTPELLGMLATWEGGRGFGTCIVLAVTEMDMRKRIAQIGCFKALGLVPLATGIIHDPSYPLLDGMSMHHIPVDTCAYAFGYKGVLEPFLSGLSLMD